MAFGVSMQAGAQSTAPAPTPAQVLRELDALKAQMETLRQRVLQLEGQLAEEKKAAPPAAPVAVYDDADGGEEGGEGGEGGVMPMAATEKAGDLEIGGYVNAVYERYDFYRNAQDDRADRRARTDLERAVVELEKSFGRGFSFAAEFEFEHGGVGSSIEFEPDEFGEFEQETEHGGEVTVEKAYLQYQYADWLGARFGHLIVPIGMANTHHDPTQYFTIRRSLGETAILPNVWHENGVSLIGTWNSFEYQAMLVSGLDSTGFTSSGFVSRGSDRKLEDTASDSLAFAARVDWTGVHDLMIGASFYAGDSRDNRPLQNLDKRATVTIAEIHGRYESGPLIIRGQYLHGFVENAPFVSAANLQSFNPGVLGVSRSPVASEAFAAYLEAGYDVFSFWPGHGRLDAFFRYDSYDSMDVVDGNVVDNPRFDRTAYTGGLNYKPRPNIVFKGEYSFRENEGRIAKEQDLFGLAVGFEF